MIAWLRRRRRTKARTWSTLTEAEAMARVTQLEAEAIDRLDGNPEFEELKRLAIEEAMMTPEIWLRRNILAIKIQMEVRWL